MKNFVNMIEMINHFKLENVNNTIFLFEVNRKPYFHNLMIKCLEVAVKQCIVNEDLFYYNDFEFPGGQIEVYEEYFDCSYGNLNTNNIESLFGLYKEEFEELFDNLSGLDMISLIQEINCDFQIDISDFDSNYCLMCIATIYIRAFDDYYHQTKEQYIDSKMLNCKRFFNITCLKSLHSPHTEIGKKHIEKLYEELQEL